MDVDVGDESSVRLGEQLARDFDGTSALFANALVSGTTDPGELLATLSELIESHDAEDSSTSSMIECMERVEIELVPQLVQLVLANSFSMRQAKRVNDFLQFVLERVARRLLQCDPSLLPTLVRILDDDRRFYGNDADSLRIPDCEENEGRELTDDITEEDGRATQIETSLHLGRFVSSGHYVDHGWHVFFLRNVACWGEMGGFTLFLRCLQARFDTANRNDTDDSTADSVGFAFDAVQCIYRALYAVKHHFTADFLLRYFLPLAESTRIYIRTLPASELLCIPRDSLLEVVQVMELFVVHVSDLVSVRSRKSISRAIQNQLEGDEVNQGDIDLGLDAEPEQSCERNQEDGVNEVSVAMCNTEDAERSACLVRLELMLRYFTSSSLERRIYGLSEVTSVLVKLQDDLTDENANYRQLKSRVVRILAWLNENRVMELIFGDKKHPELIKRSAPIFRYAVNVDVLPMEWIDALWTCFMGKRYSVNNLGDHQLFHGDNGANRSCDNDFNSQMNNALLSPNQNHEIVRTSSLVVLLEVIDFVDRGTLCQIFELAKLAPSLDLHMLKLFSAIAVRPCTPSLVETVIRYLWVALPRIRADDVVDQTLEHIEALLRLDLSSEGDDVDIDGNQRAPVDSSEFGIVNELLQTCVNCIESNTNVSIALRLLEKLGAAAFATETSVDVKVASRLLGSLLIDLKTFKASAWQAAWSRTQTSGTTSTTSVRCLEDWLKVGELTRTCLGLSFSDEYLDQVRIRLLGLRAAWLLCAISGKPSALTVEDLATVWSQCVQDAFVPEEASLCFQWLEYCFTSQLPENAVTPNRHGNEGNNNGVDKGSSEMHVLLSVELSEQLLTTKFGTLTPERITLSALCCFHNMFRRLNTTKGGLVCHVVEKEDRRHHTERDNDDTECADDAEGNVVDLVTGVPLVGITELWHMAIHASNASVAEEAITLLARCHLDFIPSLRDSSVASDHQLRFVVTCMDHLIQTKDGFKSGQCSPNDREEINNIDGRSCVVNRCLDCLRFFLEASDEAEGIMQRGVTGHPPTSSHPPEKRRGANTVTASTSPTTAGFAVSGISGAHLASNTATPLMLDMLEDKLQALDIYPSPMKDLSSDVPFASATGGRPPSWKFGQHRALLEAIRDVGEDDENESGASNKESFVDDDEYTASDTNDSKNEEGKRLWGELKTLSSGIDRLELTLDVSAPVRRRSLDLAVPEMMTRPTQITVSPTVRTRPTLEWKYASQPQRGPDLAEEDVNCALRDAGPSDKSMIVSSETDSSDQLQLRSQHPEHESQMKRLQECGDRKTPETSSYYRRRRVVADLLVNRSSYFEALFELVDWHESTSQRAWELICRLPTSTELLHDMIRLRPLPVLGDTGPPPSPGDVIWTDLLNPSSVHRTQYALRLIEALLLPVDIGRPVQHDVARRQWRERFVRLGGVLHLYGIACHLRKLPTCTSRYARQLVFCCLATVLRVLTYYVKLYKVPTDGTVASTDDPTTSTMSPFDVRLLQSSLPKLFSEFMAIDKLFTIAADISLDCCHGAGDDQDELQICAVELYCALAPLNASMAYTVLATKPDGVQLWLDALLVQPTSSKTRSHVLELLSSLPAQMPTISDGAFPFFMHQLESAMEVALDESSASHDQIFDYTIILVQYVSANATDQEDPVDAWAEKCSIISRLAMYLRHKLVPPSHSTQERKTRHEPVIGGMLRVLHALITHSPATKQNVLNFEPSHQSAVLPEQEADNAADTGSASCWLVQLITTHILWGERVTTPVINHGSSQLRSLAWSSRVRNVAQQLVLELVFSPDNHSVSSALTVLHSLRRYGETVEAKFNTLGRPWKFSPRDELRDSENGNVFAGLVNPGCVCYLNSLVQQLFMMPNFREGMFSVECVESPMKSPWRDEVLELQKLFVSLALTEFRAFDPTAFALSHRDMDGNPTDLRVQMDADEFFCLLLDRVDTFLTETKKTGVAEGNSTTTNIPTVAGPAAKTFLDECFGGVLVNQIRTEHGHMSEREEKFFALSLEVPKKQYLTESLALYVQGETLDGDNAYYCEKTQSKVSAIKRVCIKQLPRTLVCHLKRFEFDFDTMEKVKINDYLEFPEELDMYPYTSEAFAAELTPLSENSDASGEGKRTNLRQEYVYDLVGVVVHSGTSDMGHYYSFIRDRNSHKTNGTPRVGIVASMEPSDILDEDGLCTGEAEAPMHAPKWFEFNDQTVRPFDITTMGDECFGGEEMTTKWDPLTLSFVPGLQMKKRSAYMLIYEQRIDSSPPHPTAHNVSVTVMDSAHGEHSAQCLPPASVQHLMDGVQNETVEYRMMVDAFDNEHEMFIADVLEHTFLSASLEAKPVPVLVPSSSMFHMDPASLCESVTKYRDPEAIAAVAACQYAMGIAPLKRISVLSPSARSLKNITSWVAKRATTRESQDLIDASHVFSFWFLVQLVTEPHSFAADTKVALQRRSWLFDVVFMSDSRSGLEQELLGLMRACVHSILPVAFSPTSCRVEQEGKLSFSLRDSTQPIVNSARETLGVFFRGVVQMFYDRECIELMDLASGGHYPVSHSTVVHAVSLLGSFLNDCCLADATTCTEHDVRQLHELLADDTRFIDRFLLSLREQDVGSDGGDKTSAVVAPLADAVGSTSASSGNRRDLLGGSRARLWSCTYAVERSILTSVATSLGSSSLLTCPVDTGLLVHQPTLRSVVAANFGPALTPVFVHFATTAPRGHRETLVSLLMAVLEDVKMSHVDQLLGVFGAMLDAEERDPSFRVHHHILSPTCGLLEGAAYYRDHRSLHEYAFVLVEFVLLRAKDSPRLQHYLQCQKSENDEASRLVGEEDEEDRRKQIEWIKEWLVNYLDPQGNIRSTTKPLGVLTDDAASTPVNQQEDAALAVEVRDLFYAAESALGCVIFTRDTGLPLTTGPESPQRREYSFDVESLADSDASEEDAQEGDEAPEGDDSGFVSATGPMCLDLENNDEESGHAGNESVIKVVSKADEQGPETDTEDDRDQPDQSTKARDPRTTPQEQPELAI